MTPATIPDDVWCLHILPVMDLDSLYRFFCCSHGTARLVDMFSNWNRRYAACFDEPLVDLDCSGFLNYYFRSKAKIVAWGRQAGSQRIVETDYPIKDMVSAFERSTLVTLDISGRVHGLSISPKVPLSHVWGLTYYLYGIHKDSSKPLAWTSQHNMPQRISFDHNLRKVSSAGYLCVGMNDRNELFWWQCPQSSVDTNSELGVVSLAIPVEVKDFVATRCGVRIVGSDGSLYGVQLLDRYLRPILDTKIELIAHDAFRSIGQSGHHYVAHGNSAYIGDDYSCRMVPVQQAQSVELLFDRCYVLNSSWELCVFDSDFASTPVHYPGRYAKIAALKDEMYALRVL